MSIEDKYDYVKRSAKKSRYVSLKISEHKYKGAVQQANIPIHG
jgi:hypothetical protein